MADGAGYKIDSTTAHSDAISNTVGGNTGITFGARRSTEQLAIIAAAVVLAIVAAVKMMKPGKKRAD